MITIKTFIGTNISEVGCEKKTNRVLARNVVFDKFDL